ncbi:MAG: S8 family serine peptidase [Elusimicrobiaceae bacterium]|nr:S8 family serine peptidase [Elusimicrobiaceae bacterium]
MKNIFSLAALAATAMLAGCAGAPAGPSGAWTEKQTVYFDLLGVNEAWIMAGGKGVTIGIIDGGFDYDHPGLKGRIRQVYSYPGAHHPTDMRTLAHGTFIASIIGAVPVDGGMSGLCPDSEMLGADMGIIEHWRTRYRVKYFAEHPAATAGEYEKSLEDKKSELEEFDKKWLQYASSSVAGGLRALTDSGAKVIAMSLMLAGLEGDDLKQLEDAMAYAAAHDVIMIVGAGNNADYIKDYPGPNAATLVTGCSVGGAVWTQTTNQKGKNYTQGTNYGPDLDVLAPCMEVVVANPHEPAWYKVSDGPRGPYDVKFTGEYEVYPAGGTSISVAFAAGLAALVRSANPALTAEQTAEIIRKTADDFAPPGRDDANGWGRVNFYRAVSLAAQTAPAPAPAAQ